VNEPRCLSRQPAADVALADRQSQGRNMAGLAYEPLPRWAVGSLRCTHESKGGEVRELVTERRVEQRGVFRKEGRECDTPRGSVGTTERARQAAGESDRDRGCEVRHRPESGKLGDAMVEAAGMRCLQ
jgi:hypothetical protein